MSTEAIDYFLKKFEKVQNKRRLGERPRRIGSELKFPVVRPDGRSIEYPTVRRLWDYLASRGWNPQKDPHTGEVTGVTRDGEMNEDLASCETGFSKVEFSLAHTANLNTLDKTVSELKGLMGEFGRESESAFLGFGLHPVTRPGEHLKMSSKSRNLYWDTIFGGNDHIPPEDGTDVNLFTINASNQVHIDVTMEETVPAVNVFNGLAGAQVAMTANSNIWKGRVDPGHKCVAEVLWDWWLKESHATRYGVPDRKFESLEDYFSYILEFPPVYVKREGVPVGLPNCPSFADFYGCNDTIDCDIVEDGPCGITPELENTSVKSELEDLDQHFTFFWHNARLSRYFTLENRINDQQPPEDMIAIPAFTLGIMENLDSAVDLVEEYPWELLQKTRSEAAKDGLGAEVDGVKVADISRQAVEVATEGLASRGMGEEAFIEPLRKRIEEGRCPADRAAEIFTEGGAEALVEALQVK